MHADSGYMHACMHLLLSHGVCLSGTTYLLFSIRIRCHSHTKAQSSFGYILLTTQSFVSGTRFYTYYLKVRCHSSHTRTTPRYAHADSGCFVLPKRKHRMHLLQSNAFISHPHQTNQMIRHAHAYLCQIRCQKTNSTMQRVQLLFYLAIDSTRLCAFPSQ